MKPTADMTRRTVLAGGASVAAWPALATASKDNPFAALEARSGGRLGVVAHDLASGARLSYRADERFAMCSTFKFLAAAAVLKRVDGGKAAFDQRVAYGQADLLDYAPITRKYVDEGAMTLSDLCAAAVEWSDNTAGNLLLREIGGPAGLTSYARTLGDTVTRLDRTEPTLNTAIAGDRRDTTSPNAMLADMRAILTGDALSRASRELLTGWMRNCKTSANRIPSGLPKSWHSGDKTGTGLNGATNDIAIVSPPDEKTILVSAYFTESHAPAAARDAVLAEVGRIVARKFRR